MNDCWEPFAQCSISSVGGIVALVARIFSHACTYTLNLVGALFRDNISSILDDFLSELNMVCGQM
jgi:hypothetical protein